MASNAVKYKSAQQPSNPNLDGDLVALNLVKQKKAEERRRLQDAAKLSNAADITDVGFDSKETDIIQDVCVPAECEEMRREVLEAIGNDDHLALNTELTRLHKSGKSLLQKDLRDKMTSETILHTALLNNRTNTSKFIIQNESVDLLMEEFDITVQNLPSRKTALHILADTGNVKFAKLLLDRLPEGQGKDEFIRRTVLMKIEGQRPRHLSSIHIAALEGRIEMIELFVGLGVDVNHKNNKQDTPILWATRGNHIETVRTLIRMGADVNHANDKGSSPLYWAVRYGFTQLLQLLISDGKANVHQERKLGLVSPLVLGSALGHCDSVKILLDNGADVNTTIRGGQTALQLAAELGHHDVVQILLTYGSNINLSNDNGDTALTIAAKEGHIDVVQLLASDGAIIDHRDRDGRSAWHHAMELQGMDLLVTLVNCQRRRTRSRPGTKLIFGKGKTPLHIAAMKGDVQKVQALLTMGADSKSVDEAGNTFFHSAARHNQINIIEEFQKDININLQNKDGNTPLHLAASYGHLDTINILLKTAKQDIQNEIGHIPLHMAVKSHLALPDVINTMVSTMIKTNNWSLVNSQDKKGNTALHLCAKAGRADVFQELASLHVNMENEDGDTPLHVAARAGDQDVLDSYLSVFCDDGRDTNVNYRNKLGKTPLHLLAEQGNAELVKLIILVGADLDVQDIEGNTVLHSVVQASVCTPDSVDAYLTVFDVIIHLATRWWCNCKEIHYPDRDTDVYEEYMREAVLHLTSELLNNQGLSVLAWAAKQGAKDILARLFSVSNVYKFDRDGVVTYDITNVTPMSLRNVEFTSRKNSQLSQNKVDTDLQVVEARDTNKSAFSCLELIVQLRNSYIANDILDVTPFSQIVSNYWRTYQWMYGFLMVLHIIYMALLSAYGIPLVVTSAGALQTDTVTSNVTGQVNDTTTAPSSTATQSRSIFPWVLLLIWPAVVLLGVLVFMLSTSRQCAFLWDVRYEFTGGKSIWKTYGVSIIILGPWKWLKYYIFHITCIVFSVLVGVWFALYYMGNINQDYVLAVSLIIGWLLTIYFTKGFAPLHSFTAMLRQMIIRDVVRFLIIYFFVLMAFTFGMHALFQAVSPLANTYPTAWHTMFLVFNLMIGMANLDIDEFEKTYISLGRNATILRCVYIVYMILATIILLNLLIAMMNDSYSFVRSREGTSWRVSSVDLALMIEKSVPLLPKLVQALRFKRSHTTYDPNLDRYFLVIESDKLDKRAGVLSDQTTKALDRLESKINSVEEAHIGLNQQISILTHKVSDLQESVHALCKSAGADSVYTPRREKSFFVPLVKRAGVKRFGGGIGYWEKVATFCKRKT